MAMTPTSATTTTRKIAILIVFSYHNSNRSIPGTIYDLNRLVNHCLTAEFDEIRILTDFTRFDDDDFLIKKSIFDNIIKKVQVNIAYESVGSVRDVFGELKHGENRFIYYSGHCRSNLFKLPSYGEMKVNQFKMIASRNASSVFFLIDCCQCEGANLLYQVDTDSIISRNILCSISDNSVIGSSENRLSQLKVNFRNIPDSEYTRCNIISVSSSNRNGNSYSTDRGSVFTQMTMKVFTEYTDSVKKNKYLTVSIRKFIVDLDEHIKRYYSQEHKPSPSVQISRCVINTLPRWIYTSMSSVKIMCDPVRQIVVVRR